MSLRDRIEAGFESWADGVLRYRRLVVVASLILVAGLSAGAILGPGGLGRRQPRNVGTSRDRARHGREEHRSREKTCGGHCESLRTHSHPW